MHGIINIILLTYLQDINSTTLYILLHNLGFHLSHIHK